MRPVLLAQVCHMTSLTALVTRNVLLNRAVVSGMLKGESLIRFTVWTCHFGWQVQIKKALRVGSIFLRQCKHPRATKARLRFYLLYFLFRSFCSHRIHIVKGTIYFTKRYTILTITVCTNRRFC